MGTLTKQTYGFTFTLLGTPVPDAALDDDAWSDRMTVILDEVGGLLFAANCDDATLHSTGPTMFLDFDREADSLGQAIDSALADVARAGFKVARIEVEPADD